MAWRLSQEWTIKKSSSNYDKASVNDSSWSNIWLLTFFALKEFIPPQILIVNRNMKKKIITLLAILNLLFVLPILMITKHSNGIYNSGNIETHKICYAKYKLQIQSYPNTNPIIHRIDAHAFEQGHSGKSVWNELLLLYRCQLRFVLKI